MRQRVSRLLGAALAVLPGGCIASNVLAPEQRLVVADLAQLAWQPATAAAFDGLYESIDIRGDAASSLRRIWYVFQPGGVYTGAALSDVDGQFAFQTLSGTWVSSASGLCLDGGEPVPCEMAPGHLRLSAPNGALVLKKGIAP